MYDDLFSKINEGVLEERYRAFNNNLEKNLPFILKFGGLKNVINYFKGKDVIIAGAGPTLYGHFPLLKKYQQRKGLVIIATDMALLPLYQRGILPRFVISCETTPVDYFCRVETSDIHLLAFSCMSNSNLRKWKGNISFYNWMIHNKKYDVLWEKAGTGLGFVATASVVTTQAVSFALGCEVNSLMLLGNDLGFKKEYYVSGTIAHKKSVFSSNRLSTIDTLEFNKSRSRREFEIHRGNELFYTTNQFLAAKNWLEDLFKKTGVPVYESNELGCSPGSIQKLSLKEYMKRFDKRNNRRNRNDIIA